MRALHGGLVSVALAACVSRADVHTSVNPNAAFAEYATFSWAAPEGAPPGFAADPRSQGAEGRLRPLVEAALAQKGYREVPSGGDIVVSVGAGRRRAPVREVSSLSSAWLPDDENRDYVEGAVVLDAYDGKSRVLIWHGAGFDERGAQTLDESTLDHIVSDILSPFPIAAPGRAAR